MVKKISAILIAAALLGGMTSCYMPDSIFPDSAFDTEEEETIGDELSLYDFTFSLNGVEYELPLKYDVLSARGWKLANEASDEEDGADASDLTAEAVKPTAAKTNEETDDKVYQVGTMMEPGEYSDYVLTERAGEQVGLKFYNDSTRAQALEKCPVVGIAVEKGSGDSSEFTLIGDITLEKSYEEVATTYGKPSYTKDFVKSTGELAAINDIAFVDNYDAESNAFSRTLFYSVGETSVVSFGLDDNHSVVRITMDNQDEVEEEFDYSQELKRRSSVLKLYQSPNLLGKTFDDFAFKYENNLYTLPIPVQTLVNDGWRFVRGASDRIPMGTTKSGIVMRKGNLAMTIIVHNYDLKRAQAPINCYAVSLSASVVGPNVKILMPKGVTLGSDYSDLVTAFGNEYAELSGYIPPSEESEEGAANDTAESEANTTEAAAADTTAADTADTDTEETPFITLPVGTTETYELTEQEGCTIVMTVGEEYTQYSYIMPDDEPTITLPVSITDIKDPKSDELGKNRKHIDVYISNANGKVMEIYLQNAPEYVVNETQILEQQLAAAEKAAAEAAATEATAETTAASTETTAAADAGTETTAAEASSGTKTTAKTAKTTQATKSTQAVKASSAGKSSAGAKTNQSVVRNRLEVLSSLNHKG